MASDKFIIGLRAGLPSTRILKPPGGDSSDLFGLKTRQKAFYESFNKSASSMINERSRSMLDKYKDFLPSKEETPEEKSRVLEDPGIDGFNNSTSDLQAGQRPDTFGGDSNVIKSDESNQSEELGLENSVQETSSRLTTPEYNRSSQLPLEDAEKFGNWQSGCENNPESTSKCNSPNSIPSSEISFKSEGKPTDWKSSSRNSETASRCDSSEQIPSSQVSPKSTRISNSFKSRSASSPTSSSKRASIKNIRSSQASPKVVGNSTGRKSRSDAGGEFLANCGSSKQNRGTSIRKKPSSIRSSRESVISPKQVNIENSNAETESRKFIRNPITGQVTQISGFLNSKRVIDARDISEGIKMSVIDADSTRFKKAAKIYVKRNPITGEGTELVRRIHS